MSARKPVLAFAAALGVTCLAGCRPPRPKPPPPENKPAELPKSVLGKGITVNWVEDLPNGKSRRVLDVSAQSGTLTTGTQSGLLQKTSGKLYKDDKARVDFKADAVRASEEKKTIVATGSVRAVSLDPPGVTVTADKVTWLFTKNKIIAEGSVRFTYQPPGEPKPTGWGGPVPRLTIDTELKQFHVP